MHISMEIVAAGFGTPVIQNTGSGDGFGFRGRGRRFGRRLFGSRRRDDGWPGLTAGGIISARSLTGLVGPGIRSFSVRARFLPGGEWRKTAATARKRGCSVRRGFTILIIAVLITGDEGHQNS